MHRVHTPPAPVIRLPLELATHGARHYEFVTRVGAPTGYDSGAFHDLFNSPERTRMKHYPQRSTIFAALLVLAAAFGAKPLRDMSTILTLRYGELAQRLSAADRLGTWRVSSAIPALIGAVPEGGVELAATCLRSLARMAEELTDEDRDAIAQQLTGARSLGFG